MRLMSLGSALVKAGERLQTIAAGVAASRSTRDAGHSGLAQSRGHRNAVSFLQELSGPSRASAAKQVRLGESLLEAVSVGGTDSSVEATTSAGGLDDGAGAGGKGATPGEGGTGAVAAPWHAPVDAALLAGGVTTAQADAILRGLVEPPVEEGESAPRTDAVEAWRLASEQLVEEAPERTVEDLAAVARQIRDGLDPVGAEARYLARHEARSFRMWTDSAGVHHARIRFDDRGAAWVRSVIDVALRPRRGGPRFVDSEEARKAQELVDDPRTNDQLTYDLVLDVLRSGATADAEKVFGARQPGVRVIVVKDDLEGEAEGADARGGADGQTGGADEASGPGT